MLFAPGAAVALYMNLRDRFVDIAQVRVAEFDGGGAEVLVESFEFAGSRDRHDPRLLGQ